MDIYIEECKACHCKKAEELRYGFDVWINCNACPFAECYEPQTRDKYVSGTADREAEYKRKEERLRQRMMEEEEYKQSQHFRKQKSFAETIRYKVNNKLLLSPREFKKALAMDGRDAELLKFYSFNELVTYQMSLLGYSEAAKIIVNCLDDMDW